MVERHIISPSAGRMRPKTSESGIFSTNRNRPVSTSMLTRILVPKPKNAFQSPGVHIAGFAVLAVALIVSILLIAPTGLPWTSKIEANCIQRDIAPDRTKNRRRTNRLRAVIDAEDYYFGNAVPKIVMK